MWSGHSRPPPLMLILFSFVVVERQSREVASPPNAQKREGHLPRAPMDTYFEQFAHRLPTLYSPAKYRAKQPATLRGQDYRVSFRAGVRDYLRTRLARGISRLQVPPALRPNRALGKFERLARSGRALFVFADDSVHNPAPIITPLNTLRTSATAAETESVFR